MEESLIQDFIHTHAKTLTIQHAILGTHCQSNCDTNACSAGFLRDRHHGMSLKSTGTQVAEAMVELKRNVVGT